MKNAENVDPEFLDAKIKMKNRWGSTDPLMLKNLEMQAALYGGPGRIQEIYQDAGIDAGKWTLENNLRKMAALTAELDKRLAQNFSSGAAAAKNSTGAAVPPRESLNAAVPVSTPAQSVAAKIVTDEAQRQRTIQAATAILRQPEIVTQLERITDPKERSKFIRANQKALFHAARSMKNAELEAAAQPNAAETEALELEKKLAGMTPTARAQYFREHKAEIRTAHRELRELETRNRN